MTKFLTLHVFDIDFSETQSRALLDWCVARGADTFTVNILGTRSELDQYGDRVEARLARYVVPNSRIRALPAGQPGASWTRPPQLWSLTPESADILWNELKGTLIGYRLPDGGALVWLEDPALYRGPDLMLGVESHEFEGVLRIKPDEQPLLDEAGIPYRLKGEYVGY